MKLVAFDFETHLIAPGRAAPPPVCMTWAIRERPGAPMVTGITKCRGAGGSADAALMLYRWLREPETVIIGANTAFDTLVAANAWSPLLPMFFDAYDSERKITDVQVRERLIRIEKGTFKFFAHKGTVLPSKYDLDSLSRKHRGVELDKDPEGWRLRYAQLDDVPLEAWPPRATAYAIEDSIATLEVYESQRERNPKIPGEFIQCRTEFEGSALTSAHGLRTSREGIDELLRATNRGFQEIEDHLLKLGLVRVETERGERKIIRNTKIAAEWIVAACKEVGKEPLLTETGKPSVSEDACEHSEDVDLIQYAKYTTLKAVLNKDIPMLEAGLFQPISPRYTLLESLRRTTSKPNTQNLRRLRGVREAFVPREGYWYIDADYPQEELYAHAESAMQLVGWSDLGKALLTGEDPHLSLAALILGVSYDEAKKGYGWSKWFSSGDPRWHEMLSSSERQFASQCEEQRQFAKIGNFGFMGGMGPTAFVKWAWAQSGGEDENGKRKPKIKLEEDFVRRLRASWHARWTEMRAIFDLAAKESSERGYVTLPDGTIRGNVSFTQWCNSQFQCRAALASAEAWCLIQRACYVEKNSPLYGCRTVNFVHDQFILEVRADYSIARPAAKEVARLMHEGAKRWIPNFIPGPVKPCLAECHSKKATDVYDEKGELVVWKLPPWERAA